MKKLLILIVATISFAACNSRPPSVINNYDLIRGRYEGWFANKDTFYLDYEPHKLYVRDGNRFIRAMIPRIHRTAYNN